MKYKIPFNKPLLVGNEQKYMEEALGNQHFSGDGPFTRRCNEFLEKAVGASRAMLTTSCTHALEMCAMLLNIRKGDEVIVPSFAKAGRRDARASAVVSGRGGSSLATVSEPLRVLTSIGVISSENIPAASAAAQFCWLRSAKAS